MACFPVVAVSGEEVRYDGKTLIDEMSDAVAAKDPLEASKLDRGTNVDRYVVLYELGVGGMGVVYAAYDPQLDRKVALKLLHAGAGSERARNRLMREAKAIARLTHPNVVTVHDVGTFEGRVFVAMEYVDGVTFRQWVQQDQRSWEEIVTVIAGAGEGLAAAHAADLIHRDFKPDNVLVDRTGRVIVLDFGLARRATTSDEAPPEDREGDRVATDNVDELSLELTRDGAKLGTPAYMAPEQHLGAATDRRTDQFSFCVVLWEALYGMRPFKGDSQTTTAVHVVRGDLQEPPKGANVPAWIRTVLLRGLSTEPSERYPSMKSLLGALVRNPARKRRRWAIAAGVAAAVGATGLAVWATVGRGDDPCPGAGARWDGVWDPSRRSQVAAAFEATGTSFAVTASRGVQSVLDVYVAEWIDVYQDACEATHVHREQSQETMDQRMACLRARHSEARALIDEFTDADQGVVEHAVEAVSSLPWISECSDVEALSARVRLPDDDFTRARVEELRDDLHDAWAKEYAARYDQALMIIEVVTERAREINYRPVLAEALLRRGSTLERRGDYEAAERSLLESIWAAKYTGHDEVEARAWVQLVWVTGVERKDVDQGELWSRFAEAALERLGKNEVLAAALTHNVAGVRYRQERHDEALAGYRSALTDQRRLLGDDDPRVAMTLNHIGNVLMEQGRYPESQEYCERSLQARRRVLGRNHPKVAASLNNLAEASRKQKRANEAIVFAKESLGIVADTGGPEEEVALVIAGWAQEELGELESAYSTYTRLLEVRLDGEEGGGVGVVYALHRLGALQHGRGEFDDAADRYRRAVEADRGVRPASAVQGLLGLTAALAAMRRNDDARAALREAQTIVQTERLDDSELLERIAAQDSALAVSD